MHASAEQAHLRVMLRCEAGGSSGRLLPRLLQRAGARLPLRLQQRLEVRYGRVGLRRLQDERATRLSLRVGDGLRAGRLGRLQGLPEVRLDRVAPRGLVSRCALGLGALAGPARPCAEPAGGKEGSVRCAAALAEGPPSTRHSPCDLSPPCTPSPLPCRSASCALKLSAMRTAAASAASRACTIFALACSFDGREGCLDPLRGCRRRNELLVLRLERAVSW